MTKGTWEILGEPTMIPSLGRIGLFKGKMITLCGRVTNLPIVIHGTSTEEEFEVIKFVENNAPFPLLLGKTWIEKDQIRRKVEEEDTENKKQELRDFIARKIYRPIKEREVKSKQQKARDLAVKFERTQEYLKDLSMQEKKPLEAHQQCEVTTPGEDKNTNGKRNPETIRETHITGKKARNLSKKKAKLEKLQEVT
jgi:hypothetical protein